MNDIRRWFLWTLIIGPIHMCEQLMTSLDELQELKGFAAKYYGGFANPDVGTVVLVMIVFTLMNLIVYGMLLGGKPRLIAVGLFAAVAIGEVHHIIKTVVHLQYFPGTVTAIPFVIFGLFLLRAIIREWRVNTAGSKSAALAA
jgi:hypothetical protein